MRGADVVELMRRLVAHKVLQPEKVNTDSLYTVHVETAVRMFQAAQRVAVDGKVGATTALLLKLPPS